MRKVTWSEKASYGSIVQSYRQFLESNYGKCVIVFDGYSELQSTKDQEHARRSAKSSPTFNVRNETILNISQQVFLGNSKNKAGLIQLLTTELTNNGHTVHQAASDADTLIVENVVKLAAASTSVKVLANDTDVIVMLLYHWTSAMSKILIQSDIKRKGHKEWKQIEVKKAIC